MHFLLGDWLHICICPVPKDYVCYVHELSLVCEQNSYRWLKLEYIDLEGVTYSLKKIMSCYEEQKIHCGAKLEVRSGCLHIAVTASQLGSIHTHLNRQLNHSFDVNNQEMKHKKYTVNIISEPSLWNGVHYVPPSFLYFQMQ